MGNRRVDLTADDEAVLAELYAADRVLVLDVMRKAPGITAARVVEEIDAVHGLPRRPSRRRKRPSRRDA